ncbi:MAG: hydrogenase maturation nickel metallochaperone HypA [Alphaproteobacteria bacterium]|nr:hydrogenase maturation nickel metallochaperone HypA [Alphaproteobacteria bacterium]
MHEMSLTNGILRILEDQARTRNFSRVRTVWLEIGTLSHVDPEAIRFCFESTSKGTIAEEACLVILEPAGQAWCLDCSQSVTVTRRGDPCPICGGFMLHVTGGEELRITELEVE